MKKSSTEKKLDEILKLQKKILREEKSISKTEQEVLKLEKEELKGEKEILAKEDEELATLKRIEELEKKISKDTKGRALRKITYRDITKGIIGSFFGIVGHFAFAKGVGLSQEFSFLRSTTLFITSFIIIVLFLYFAGFRKVDDEMLFKFLPVRALVIYFTAIFTTLLVLTLYAQITINTPFIQIYNTLAAVSVLAVMGAGTADLIGELE